MIETRKTSGNHGKKKYLYDRISVYFFLLAIIIIVSLIILSLPYGETYIREAYHLDSSRGESIVRTFAIIATIATTIFILGTFYNIMTWMEGRLSNEEERLPKSTKLVISTRRFFRAVFSRDFGKQFAVFIKDSLFIGKLWKINKLRWFAHAMILFGFIGMFILDLITVLALDIFHYSAFIEPTGWGKLWIRDFGFDLFGLMVLIGLIGAIVRRFIFAPKQLVTGREDFVSVVFLFIVILGGFILEGLAIGIEFLHSSSQPDYSFVGISFSYLMNSPNFGPDAYAVSWFIHATMSLAFVAYIPFSKLFHFFAAPMANQIDEIIRRRGSSG